MANFEDKIIQNINSLIYSLRSKGIEELSVTKFLLFINDKYRVQLDQNALEEILTDNDSVASIVDDKIIIGSKSSSDKDDVNDNIRDKAIDQAADNLGESISKDELINVLKLYENVKVGNEIDASKLKLNESYDEYFELSGVKKAKSKLVISKLMPSTTVANSKIKCKIKDSNLTINVPITAL